MSLCSARVGLDDALHTTSECGFTRFRAGTGPGRIGDGSRRSRCASADVATRSTARAMVTNRMGDLLGPVYRPFGRAPSMHKSAPAACGSARRSGAARVWVSVPRQVSVLTAEEDQRTAIACLGVLHLA